MPRPIDAYSLVDDEERETLKRAIQSAYQGAGTISRFKQMASESENDENESGGLSPGEMLKLAKFDELIGLDSSVLRQIEAAINSGKKHLMFYGPPGTGKTTLARWLAGRLNGHEWTMITGSADWTSQEIIGGYQPIESGAVKFFPGVLLSNFDRPLVIDELNRCDIDKVIGPLFTVLSGQQTTLPYRINASEPTSSQYVVLPNEKANPQAHEFAPGPAWRLIATINSIDKASLYQMSYALSRRFGWIYVDTPKDTKGFIKEYLEQKFERSPQGSNETPPLAAIWDAINQIRPIGPAPIVDAIKSLDMLSPNADLVSSPIGDLRVSYLDVFDLYMLPLLDGILKHEAEEIARQVAIAIGLPEDGEEYAGLKRRLNNVAA